MIKDLNYVHVCKGLNILLNYKKVSTLKYFLTLHKPSDHYIMALLCRTTSLIIPKSSINSKTTFYFLTFKEKNGSFCI